jgi:hypothetical protein
MDRSRDRNRVRLATLMSVFRTGAALLVLEVVAWVVALIVHA